jgi:putative membrane protein
MMRAEIETGQTAEADLRLEKRLNVFAYILSAVVLLLVGMMRRIKLDVGIDFGFLPPLHATLNTLTAIILMLAYYFIRNKRVEAHRRSIYAAMMCSALFLVSYVLYHFTTPETRFGGEGVIRLVYFFFLVTHVVLAALILPFILLTFNRAYTAQYSRHKKMARWVWPLWLYVAITGPICYLMLLPYYK